MSAGVWSEFSELWLKNQDISIANIGIIIAAASFLTGVFIVLLTKYTRKINEIVILKMAFSIKIIFLIGMVLGYHFEIKWMSVGCFIIDAILNNLIVLITYPIISYILKDEKIYSKRKIAEYSATDTGLLIASFLIGRSIGGVVIDYNFMLIISIFFVIGAIISAFMIKNDSQFIIKERPNIKRIFKDKILGIYVFYHFVGHVAYSSALGMELLLLVNYGNFSDSAGSLFIVICCILGDIFAVLALKKLTPKNDYLTIFLKFGIRCILYFLIIMFPIKEMMLVALAFSLFISRAYENKVDAVYFNRCSGPDMFTFANIRFAVGYIGKSLGIMLCGFMFEFGLRYIFSVSVTFMILQISLAFLLIKLRHNEDKKLKEMCKENSTVETNTINQNLKETKEEELVENNENIE